MSDLVVMATVSGRLVSTGVCDMPGVDGVAGRAADDPDSLALAAAKHTVPDKAATT